MYKAWVCTNMACGYNVKIRSGEVVINEPISYGASRGNLKGVHAGQRSPR
ncbi:MAG: hypothetical protein ACRDJN_10050 [Chloroflexota bacterium]